MGSAHLPLVSRPPVFVRRKASSSLSTTSTVKEIVRLHIKYGVNWHFILIRIPRLDSCIIKKNGY